jgi:hypothetical protein
VAAAAVPETSVNENRQLKFREYKIRFAKDRLMSPPPRDAMPPYIWA